MQNDQLGIGNWTVVSQTRDGMQVITLNEYEYLYMSYDFGVTWVARTAVGAHGWTSGTYVLMEEEVGPFHS